VRKLAGVSHSSEDERQVGWFKRAGAFQTILLVWARPGVLKGGNFYSPRFCRYHSRQAAESLGRRWWVISPSA
jgi:hypothetical protein